VVCDYAVIDGGKRAFGRLYYAEVKTLEPLPDYEIEEILLSDKLPIQLTYPHVQPLLFSLLTSP
jgi:hypothetical protein